MNDPVLIRQAVRRVLALRPRSITDGLTEQFIFDAVKMLGYRGLTVPELRVAMEWNLTRDFVSFAFNDDVDADLWDLTPKGKAKEGIA